jgi:hypothetical protein
MGEACSRRRGSLDVTTIRGDASDAVALSHFRSLHRSKPLSRKDTIPDFQPLTENAEDLFVGARCTASKLWIAR